VLGGDHETLSAHRNRRDAKPNLANALVFVCALAVAGCASKAVVTEDHSFPTGIATGDAVAFLLSKYEGEKKEQFEQKLFSKEQFEQKLFSCVSRELKNSRLGLRIISPREFRQTAFSGLTVDQHPKSAGDVFELLGDGRSIGDPSTSRLRYVVLLDVTVSESPKQWDLGVGQAGAVVYKEWMKYVRLNSTVLDVGQRRVAGSLLATSEGEQGTGVGVAIIVPFPIIVRTDPLGKACTKIGQELAHFLVN
jgi:hypothetical protein